MSDRKSPSRIMVSRRGVVRGIGGTLALSTMSITPRGLMAQEDVLLEAPELARLVQEGRLPPLAERLPAEPMVVTPVEGPGRYGGTWATATTGAGDAAWWWRTTGYENLTRMSLESGRVEPNVAQSYDVLDGGRRFVFHLRPGMRWSDGEPFTADDIVFWYNDFCLHPDLLPAGPPSWMRTASGPGTVEKDGDQTVVFTFAEPNGFLPNRMCTDQGHQVVAMPRHYLAQFHPAHNPDVEALAQSEGFNSWPDLFLNKSGQGTLFLAAGLPVIRPWAMQTVLGTGNRLAFERNPYYWKVDPNGSQLPYINRVVFDIIEDTQVMLLRATNGEFSYHMRHINSPANKPVLARSQEERGYRLIDLVPSTMNEGVIALNLTHDDPVKRQIYNDKEFRIALSHATNRTEIINAVYQRQGRPWQAAPRPESTFYNEALATQYLEYDVDLANDILDQAGYRDRNSDGIRLGPDGNPIHIQFLASTTGGAQEALLIDVEQILKQQWAQIGIDIDTHTMERSLFIVRTGNEEQDALMWTGFGGHDLVLRLDPRWYLPTTVSQSNFAAKWALWYNSDGAEGETPPPEVQRQYELYRDALATPDDAERDDLFQEILVIAQQQFYVIGTTISLPTYSIKSDAFHNVPESQPDAWPYPSPGLARPEQFWIET